jgi:predicted metal-dependent peptidase
MIEARTRICLSQEFWHTLVLRLSLKEEKMVPTAATDGHSLLYNPEFISSLTNEELEGIWVHETMHCALGHIWRLPRLQHQMKANIAADFAINPLLLDAGYSLPSGCLYDEEFKGKSAEWIYDQLPDPPEQQGSPAPGQGEPILPPPEADGQDPQADPTVEQDWKQALSDVAEAAKRRGDLPAGLEDIVDRALKPRTDPLSELMRFVAERAKDDFSWRRMNKAYAPHGLILPSLYSERVGPIAVWVDTSGSCWHKPLLSKFLAWCQALLDDFKPSELRVYQGDAKAQDTRVYEFGDDIELKVKGGGGTDVEPIIAAAMKEDTPPVAFIGLTDMYANFGPEPPVPVLWVTHTDPRHCKIPFGQVIHIPDE